MCHQHSNYMNIDYMQLFESKLTDYMKIEAVCSLKVQQKKIKSRLEILSLIKSEKAQKSCTILLFLLQEQMAQGWFWRWHHSGQRLCFLIGDYLFNRSKASVLLSFRVCHSQRPWRNIGCCST